MIGREEDVPRGVEIDQEQSGGAVGPAPAVPPSLPDLNAMLARITRGELLDVVKRIDRSSVSSANDLPPVLLMGLTLMLDAAPRAFGTLQLTGIEAALEDQVTKLGLATWPEKRLEHAAQVVGLALLQVLLSPSISA